MPLVLDFTAGGLSSLSEKLRSFGSKDSAERDGLIMEVLDNLGLQLEVRLREDTPVGATGRLVASTHRQVIKREVENDESEFVLSLIQDATNRGFMYRPVVVRGRQPGRMPPPLALRGWVRTKWGMSGAEVIPASFRLARHIARAGTQENLYPLTTIRRSYDLINQASSNLGLTLSVALTDIDPTQVSFDSL